MSLSAMDYIPNVTLLNPSAVYVWRSLLCFQQYIYGEVSCVSTSHSQASACSATFTRSVCVLRHSVVQPSRLLSPWDSPGKNTGVGCHFFLQGIFPTQGWNPHLLKPPPFAGGYFPASATLYSL